MIALAIAALALEPGLEQLERCRAAVHGAIETAVVVCQPPAKPVDLWAPETAADRCRPALERGVAAGKSAPGLPENMRAGLVRYFDQAVAACTAPRADKELPRRSVRQLWD